MATRSLIGMEQSDGTIRYVCCHFDGYPEYVGRILQQHYSDTTKLERLLELVDLSVLGEEIGKKQDFSHPTSKQWCIAYGRDRGDANVEAKISYSAKWFRTGTASKHDVDYAYYLNRKGEWKGYKAGATRALKQERYVDA
jgi:hypothetical protein